MQLYKMLCRLVGQLVGQLVGLSNCQFFLYFAVSRLITTPAQPQAIYKALYMALNPCSCIENNFPQLINSIKNDRVIGLRKCRRLACLYIANLYRDYLTASYLVLLPLRKITEYSNRQSIFVNNIESNFGE